MKALSSLPASPLTQGSGNGDVRSTVHHITVIKDHRRNLTDAQRPGMHHLAVIGCQTLLALLPAGEAMTCRTCASARCGSADSDPNSSACSRSGPSSSTTGTSAGRFCGGCRVSVNTTVPARADAGSSTGSKKRGDSFHRAGLRQTVLPDRLPVHGCKSRN